MKLYVITNNDTEIESVSDIKSILLNSKGIEIELEDTKLTFEKK